MSSGFTKSDSDGFQGPPLIGALLRMPWSIVRERLLEGLHEAGFEDLVAPHLNVLQYPGPHNQHPSELAAQARISKQAMNYLLGQMEQLGYLTRIRDPDDRRSKIVRLTDRGHAAIRQERVIVTQVETDWQAKLGAERFALLQELLLELSAREPNGDRESG